MEAILGAKQVLSREFENERYGLLSYFVGIEKDKSTDGIFLPQKEYITYILKQYDMLKFRSIELPIYGY